MEFGGYKGNFKTEVLVGPDMKQKKIDHGVMIVATGAAEYQPTEYLYRDSDAVVTQAGSGGPAGGNTLGNPDRVIMIQCVGSRNDDNPNCSRICCQNAVKNAIAIKEQSPDTDVFVLYRDMRTYAMLEEYYTKARKMGVIFPGSAKMIRLGWKNG